MVVGAQVQEFAHVQGFGLDRHVLLVSFRHQPIGTSYDKVFV